MLPEGLSGRVLLHGFGDTYATWVTSVPSIKDDADAFRFIIVCPDASKS